MSEKSPKNVLFVCYDSSVGKLAKRILREDNHAVEIIHTEKPAMEQVRESLDKLLADVVVTDWTRVDGSAVIAMSTVMGVKNIIVMNGDSDEGGAEIRRLNEDGMVKVIKKPFPSNDSFRQMITNG